MATEVFSIPIEPGGTLTFVCAVSIFTLSFCDTTVTSGGALVNVGFAVLTGPSGVTGTLSSAA